MSMMIAKQKFSTKLSRFDCFTCLDIYKLPPTTLPQLMSTAYAHSYTHLFLTTTFSSKHSSGIIALDTCFDNKVNFEAD